MPWFTEETKLSQWLTRSGSIGRPGDATHLVLRNGDEVHGHVLDATNRELAVSWPNANVALELKAFSMGATRMLGVRATGWGVGAERMQALEVELKESLTRLTRLLA
jgi:hypothetical protein